MSSISRLSMRASMGESGVRVLPEMFKHKLLQSSEETVNALQRIWREAGYEEAECQRLLGDLLNKIKLTCTNEIAAEQQILDHAKLQIESSIEELRSLNVQLGRETQVDYLAVMHCTDKLAELEKLLNEVSATVADRQKLLDVEMNGIAALVNEMGESTPAESEFRGPAGTPHLSDVRLQLMREYRKRLESLKTKRVEEMKEIAQEAFAHMTDLVYAEEGYCTMSDSEAFLALDKQIARWGKHQEFAFSVHRKELSQLSARLERFVEEKDKRRSELAKTGEEIARLWTLLRVPSVEREAFQNSFKKNLSMETLSKGLDELQRLREIRKTSLGRVVTSIRNDILSLWEEAGIESEESRRKEFPQYFDDVETLEDSSVEVHETYFNALRARVEELKPILLKISRRETVVQERIELEHLQMNPERLTARGPNAREERKREEAMTNRVKNLEKLTKEIISQVGVWEESNGPFIYAGERYVERITRQEESYIEIRDALRNARKKKDGKAETITAGKTLPIKRTLASSTHIPPTPHMGSASSSMRNTASKTLAATPAAPVQATPLPPAPPADNSENVPPSRGVNISRDSESTIYTSATQVKDRSSSGSMTVVRECS